MKYKTAQVQEEAEDSKWNESPNPLRYMEQR